MVRKVDFHSANASSILVSAPNYFGNKFASRSMVVEKRSCSIIGGSNMSSKRIASMRINARRYGRVAMHLAFNQY